MPGLYSYDLVISNNVNVRLLILINNVNRRPFKDIDPFLLGILSDLSHYHQFVFAAPTCILLAAKVEESGIIAPNKLLNATNNARKLR